MTNAEAVPAAPPADDRPPELGRREWTAFDECRRYERRRAPNYWAWNKVSNERLAQFGYILRVEQAGSPDTVVTTQAGRTRRAEIDPQA